MGLTTEQWHTKRTKEILEYVVANGERLSSDEIYWHTYPVCTKDICVSGALAKHNELIFGDLDKNNKFIPRKYPADLERIYLEEILIDMKRADGLKVADRKKPGKKSIKK